MCHYYTACAGPHGWVASSDSLVILQGLFLIGGNGSVNGVGLPTLLRSSQSLHEAVEVNISQNRLAPVSSWDAATLTSETMPWQTKLKHSFGA